MGANFYDHFKNKDLKNLFKRLCTQNQQRKFNALGHNYKKCPQNALHDAADVGPSGNPRDGAPPTFR